MKGIAYRHRYAAEASELPKHPPFDVEQHGSALLRAAMQIPEHLLDDAGKLSIAQVLEAETAAHPHPLELDRLLTLHPVPGEPDVWPDEQEYDHRKLRA